MTKNRIVGNVLGKDQNGETTTTVQGSRYVERYKRVIVRDSIVKMAEAEYERQYGQDQPAKQLRERGGLSLGKVVHLLAEALMRYAPEKELIPRSEWND